MQPIPPSADQPQSPTLFGETSLVPATVLPGFFRQLFSDDLGNPSSARAAMLVADVIVLGVWAVNSLQTRVLQPIPESVVMVLFGVHGFKFAQKFREPQAKPGMFAPFTTAVSTGAATEAGGPASAPGQRRVIVVRPAAPAPGQPVSGQSELSATTGKNGDGDAGDIATTAAAVPSSPEVAAQP